MIEVQVGSTGRAMLEGGTWTSESEAIQRILQGLTADIAIHGGMPDPDEFIVQEIMKQMSSVTIISRGPSPEDPEAEADDDKRGAE